VATLARALAVLLEPELVRSHVSADEHLDELGLVVGNPIGARSSVEPGALVEVGDHLGREVLRVGSGE
jgi:hypothetical protein